MTGLALLLVPLLALSSSLAQAWPAALMGVLLLLINPLPGRLLGRNGSRGETALAAWLLALTLLAAVQLLCAAWDAEQAAVLGPLWPSLSLLAWLRPGRRARRWAWALGFALVLLVLAALRQWLVPYLSLIAQPAVGLILLGALLGLYRHFRNPR